MKRGRPGLERGVLAVSFIGWAAALAALLGILPLHGRLAFGFYPLYATAAAMGWLAGNLYVSRRHGLAHRAQRRTLLLIYLLGPPGLLFMLRAMEPLTAQQAAPFAATWALGVYAILFFVPVTLKPR